MESQINFLDSYNVDFLKARANRKMNWSALYSPLRYKSKVKDNPKLSTFDENSIKYDFNSHGFRCDEFNNEDTVKILYSGCSHTEGIGIPVELTWPRQMNQLISQEIGKSFGYYNVAVAGASWFSAIRMAYVTVRSGLFTPDLVVMLLPSPLQIEFIKEYCDGEIQPYNFSSVFTQKSNAFGLLQDHENAMNFQSPLHLLHLAFKELTMLIDYLSLKGIQCYFDSWYPGKFVLNSLSGEAIPFYDIIKTHSPIAVKNSFINNLSMREALMSDSFEHRIAVKDTDWPNNRKKLFTQNCARDGFHYGPNLYHWAAEEMYSNLKLRDGFASLLSNWKSKE